MVVVISATVLDDFYKAEKDADVRERLLLIRSIKLDNKEDSKCGWLRMSFIDLDGGWAYKWPKRFNKGEFEGLKDR